MINNKIHKLGEGLLRLKRQEFPAFAGLIGQFLPSAEALHSPGMRKRVFSPWVTLILFVYQILVKNMSCDAIVQRAITWLGKLTGRNISPNNSAYAQARRRLDRHHFSDCLDALVDRFPQEDRFHGYLVRVVDGSGISMADTPENRKAFPFHPKAGSGSGFPAVKLLAVFSLHLGIIVDWAVGNIIAADRVLFQSIWPNLSPGHLVLGDRGFCGFGEFMALDRRGVKMVTRKHGRRKYQEIIRHLGPGDRIVAWERPRQSPDWIEKEEWESFPDTLQVREITYSVAIPGFRTRNIEVVTTLLDESIPPADFAGLYRKRWTAELFLRDIKITMGMDMLKCKTPDMIDKEFQAFILAYNIVRKLMAEVASQQKVLPENISLQATLVGIEVWGPIFASAQTSQEAEEAWNEFCRVVGYRRNRHRKNRSEPRAKKRRPKNYQLLKGDRSLFKPIPHRNKYKIGRLT